MDVVNGEIVPARTERSKSDIWRALQPSGVHLRPGVGSTTSLGMNPGPARWNRRPRDTHSILSYSVNPLLQFSESKSFMDDLGVQDPCRAGWKRSCIEQDHHQPLVRSSASGSSDPESGLHSSTCVKEMQLQQLHLETGDAPQTRRTGSSEGPEGSGAAVVARERRGVELSTVDHDGVTWIAPLRSLLRKELTASDVGALGRIVLPKKDAEGQLPLLETNAKYLEMDEYSFARRWLFQYKYVFTNILMFHLNGKTNEDDVSTGGTSLHAWCGDFALREVFACERGAMNGHL